VNADDLGLWDTDDPATLKVAELLADRPQLLWQLRDSIFGDTKSTHVDRLGHIVASNPYTFERLVGPDGIQRIGLRDHTIKPERVNERLAAMVHFEQVAPALFPYARAWVRGGAGRCFSCGTALQCREHFGRCPLCTAAVDRFFADGCRRVPEDDAEASLFPDPSSRRTRWITPSVRPARWRLR
jgi:hypothetical protein